MNKNEWLENLKEGHEVIVAGRNNSQVCRVEKATKNFLMVDGKKYRRSNGSKIGGTSFYYSFLQEINPEKVNEIRKENKLRNLRFIVGEMKVNSLSIEQLEKIASIIKVDQ